MPALPLAGCYEAALNSFMRSVSMLKTRTNITSGRSVFMMAFTSIGVLIYVITSRFLLGL